MDEDKITKIEKAVQRTIIVTGAVVAGVYFARSGGWILHNAANRAIEVKFPYSWQKAI